MKLTPLHDVHEKLGARMVEFGGWQMPVQYGPILEEVTTVRTKAGLFDLSHMGRVCVSGKDRERFLDTICTNFVAKIPLGAIRYTLFCRADGNPIDDLLVYRSADEVFLVVNASNTDEDLAWMRHHARGFEVVIQDQTEELAMIALQGQASQATLQEMTRDLDLASIGYYKFGYGTVADIPNMRVSRTGYTGEDGFELYIPKDDAVRVWNECLAHGTKLGLKPIGLAARDTLRLEAGMPLYGHEIDATHNPIEAGLEFGVSFKPEKGDWIGRDALEKIAHNKTRHLVGVRTDGPRVPRQGYELYAVGSDEKLGEIVSGSVSPTIGANIGTGYTGEDGFELYIPKDDAVRVWNECLAHGTKLGLKPIGLAARDTLRLEAGMPLYGHEIDATHNPIEAGLDFGVSFKPEKGDWIGRDALEKIAAKKTRRLVGVRTDGPRVPRQGYELYSVGGSAAGSAPKQAGGERLGEIVSGSVSPTIGANIGTGYVPVGHGKPGDPVEIDIKGKRQAATFCALPFFSRTRK